LDQTKAPSVADVCADMVRNINSEHRFDVVDQILITGNDMWEHV